MSEPKAARAAGLREEIAQPSQPWNALAANYERARLREDSLDRLVEWPAQRELLGDVRGVSILDIGCGSGAKLAELVAEGAGPSVGVDASGTFIPEPPDGLTSIRGDMNDMESIGDLTRRTFDRVLFLQSFGYATDPVRCLVQARNMLSDGGFILLTRTHPIRYAVERAEANGTSLGEEYYAGGVYSYASGWNEQITLAHSVFTVADLLNQFSAAGLRIERALEPRLTDKAARKYPHKAAWLNKHLGVMMFDLRPFKS
ncbi:class I SAM-dependent methyltransferase [Microbacterium sp. KNMS]